MSKTKKGIVRWIKLAVTSIVSSQTLPKCQSKRLTSIGDQVWDQYSKYFMPSPTLPKCLQAKAWIGNHKQPYFNDQDKQRKGDL